MGPQPPPLTDQGQTFFQSAQAHSPSHIPSSFQKKAGIDTVTPTAY